MAGCRAGNRCLWLASYPLFLFDVGCEMGRNVAEFSGFVAWGLRESGEVFRW